MLYLTTGLCLSAEGDGKGLRNVPKKRQADVDQEIGTAASDSVDTDWRDCKVLLAFNSIAHDKEN